MATEVIQVDPVEPDPRALKRAAECLAAGGLAVIPTETVYGVAANVLDAGAMERLCGVKGRGAGKPFTLHIGSRSAVERYVPEMCGLGRRLVRKGWPGPLTIVFPVSDPRQAAAIREQSEEHIGRLYHEGTIGIRCPDDAVAAEVLTRAGVPIVAASANRAGGDPPVTGEAAAAALEGLVDVVLDAGRTRYAGPSTVVRIEGHGFRILREGILDERSVRRLCRVVILVVCTGNTCRSPMAEGLLRNLLSERLGCGVSELGERGYHVESAGVGGGGGMGASAEAVAVMRGRGIDIAGHRSSPLTLEAIGRSDYILTMTAGHLRAVRSMSPDAGDRCRLVDEEDVEDPIGGDEEDYRRCADRIEAALRRLVEEVLL